MSNNLPEHVQRELRIGFLEILQASIRDLAATVVNQAETRKAHPTYGYTKTKIRDTFARLNGALGVYCVAAGITASPLTIPTVIAFEGETGPRTAEIVNRARDAVASL